MQNWIMQYNGSGSSFTEQKDPPPLLTSFLGLMDELPGVILWVFSETIKHVIRTPHPISWRLQM